MDKAYREATEEYSGQVKLAPDGRSVIGHVAGLPFPNIDPNDPQIALKLMWNYDYKPYWTDDITQRDTDADAGPVSGSGPMEIERHFLIDHMRAKANPQLDKAPKFEGCPPKFWKSLFFLAGQMRDPLGRLSFVAPKRGRKWKTEK